MHISGKTKAVREWLATCPFLGDYLKLNAAELKDGELAVDTVYNDAEIRRFINGTSERAYTFSVVFVRDWSSGFDSVNDEAMEYGEKLADWLGNQFAAGNLPAFENCTIENIEPLQNVPGLAAAYQEEQLARYMMQARITYRES